ncbi:putative inactive receptor kinase [Nymphaea thermarum]|nr:putative inactive receptor kinase [Nymphaea thermarum]
MASTATLLHPLLLVLFLLLCGFFEVVKPDLAGDKAALLTLRSAVGRFLPWNQSDSTPCAWQGVECGGGRVTALHLPGLGLMGVIPSGVFGGLTAVRTVSLRFNALSGPLPSDFGQLADLRNLYLQQNRFSGPIPPGLFGLQKLVRVNLASNNFSGEIPPAFNNLTRLATLILDTNELSGSIPDLNLTNLAVGQFNISFNRLNGTIPTSLGRLGAESFAGNLALCGNPLPPCPGVAINPFSNSTTVSGGGENGNAGQGKRHRKLSGAAIAGIVIACAVAVVVLAYICLMCVGKKQSNRRKTGAIDMAAVKPPPPDPVGLDKSLDAEEGNVGGAAAAGLKEEYVVAEKAEVAAAAAAAAAGGKKLVFFAGSRRGFDLEDLLRASAEVLGKGTFGTAYKAVLEGGSVVAVKRLKDVSMNQRDFAEQIDKIGSMVHRNLVPLRAYYYSKEEKLLVYDYMSMGSLSALLHGSRGAGRTPLNWETRSQIALGAARGIEYLHSQGPNVSHGNIKSSNVLLTKEYDGCVSDFGLATLVSAAPSTNRVIGYRAPEVTDPTRISQKADVYSFGVLLLELLTGKPPAHALLNEEGVDLPRWVQSVVREEWTAEVFDLELLRYQNVEEDMVQSLQLAMDCAANYPDQRPTMREVVRRIEELRRNVTSGHDDEEGAHSSQRTANSIEDTGSNAPPPPPSLFD